MLTENSGLLDRLTPGDVILADRGFDIQETVGLFCSTIKIPAFPKGKKQLSGTEVEQTRRIANVRIHVERVIGNIRKKFSILSATQPIDFVTTRNGDVTTLDKIVTICCALVNICDSVVPFYSKYCNTMLISELHQCQTFTTSMILNDFWPGIYSIRATRPDFPLQRF